MIKFNKIILVCLLSCLFFGLNSYVDSKIRKVVQEGNIKELELALQNNNISKDDMKDLLEIAKEMEKLKQIKLTKGWGKLKKVIKVIKHVDIGLMGILTAIPAVAGMAGSLSLYLGNVPEQYETAVKILSPAGILVSFGLGWYTIYLYKRLHRFKSKQDQYLDAISIRQVLTRACEK